MKENREELKEKVLEIAIKAAVLAGEHALKLRESSDFKVSFKGTRDLVTDADTECEKIIIDLITENFPDHNILSEESSPELLEGLGSGPLWVIDPIDGTTNFAHGQAHVGVSIGFAIDGIREVGVVYCPFLNELYTAKKGSGAFCNDKPIEVREVSVPEHAIITTGFPYQRTEITGVLKRVGSVVKKYRDLRRLGAASVDICWVASGKLDGYFEDVCPWDVTAGLLIANEAGAYIGNYEEINNPPLAWKDSEITPKEIDGTRIVVCSPGIAEDLVSTLNA